MMKKMLSALICVFVVVTLFVGCSAAQAEVELAVEPEPELADATELEVELELVVADENEELVEVFSGHAAPADLYSVEEFHNFLLNARAFVSGIIPPYMSAEEEANARTAVNTWGLGGIEHYFVPFWIPDGFRLIRISVTDWEIWYSFVIDGYHNSSQSWEHFMNNTMSFSWTIGVQNAENLMNNTIVRAGLESVAGVVGLYYREYGSTSNPDISLVRSYYWVQNGYMFRLDIPLWVIEEHAHQHDGFGRAGTSVGDSIADLVMNSALLVGLVDSERYVSPTDIEIDASGADIAVGDTLTLTANVSPDNATIDAVIWSSSDNSVAIVSQNGVVTRLREGTATITARTVANNLTATFELGTGNMQ